MAKTLYSLMLSEDVIRAVDTLAGRSGMNRSAFVNQILADYVSVSTPEGRIRDIFRTMEALIASSQELIPQTVPNSATMAMKSILSYKYRPTIRYEVDLRSGEEKTLGTFSVIFRTQSAALLGEMDTFFRLWAKIEYALLSERIHGPLQYQLHPGKFIRPLLSGGKKYTAEQTAQGISDYVKLFDSQLRGFLSGAYGKAEMENAYAMYLQQNQFLV